MHAVRTGLPHSALCREELRCVGWNVLGTCARMRVRTHLHTSLQLESITIWADLRSTGSRGYPAFQVATPLAPVRVFLLGLLCM